MGSYYKAEFLKNRHTAVEKIIFIMPLISVTLAAVLTHNYFAIDSYNWWYAMLFPAMMALVSGMTGARDKKLGNRAIWTIPADMGKVWDGKVLYGIIADAAALLVVFFSIIVWGNVMERGFHMTFIVQPSLGQQAAAAAVLFITSVWQIPFCMLLQQILGLFPTVLLHMGSYILLSMSVSLKSYFMLFPGAISARLMCSILRVLPNGLPAVRESITYSEELVKLKYVPIGIIASLLWFLIFWRLGRKWFERQVEK